MADRYKNATAASEILNAQCTSMQAENNNCRNNFDNKEQLQKTREELLQQTSSSWPLGFDQELQQKLQEAKAARAEATETRSKNIEDQLQLAKPEVGKWLEAKDDLIQKLHRQLAQQQETMRQNAEQVKELEEYVNV